MFDDYIPIYLFIIIFGSGFICGILISSAIYEEKLNKAEKILNDLIKDIENDK